MAELERLLLQEVDSAGNLADSAEFATKHQLDHNAVVGQIKSLLAADMVEAQVGRVLQAWPQLFFNTLHSLLKKAPFHAGT